MSSYWNNQAFKRIEFVRYSVYSIKPIFNRITRTLIYTISMVIVNETMLRPIDADEEVGSVARGQKKDPTVAIDFVLSPRLSRFTGKSYRERFIEAILTPVFRRASPQSQLAWEDLRSYTPQVRLGRCGV